MKFEELHEILDNENYKLSLKELQQVIYELKQDCFHETLKLFDELSMNKISKEHYTRDNSYYNGEINGFQICLDLLKHLDNSKAKFYYDKCKSYGIEYFYDKELEEDD